MFRSYGRDIYANAFQVLNGSTQFNTYASDKEKLAVVLSNPALLKVFTMQCDLFSMGRVCVKDADGNEIDNDPFLQLIKNPNPYSSKSQFLWDYMFWTMMGTSYCYADSSLVDKKSNKLYFLEPHKIEWPLEFERIKDKLIFSDDTLTQIKKKTITYRYDDGSAYQFPFDRIIQSFDITNGIGNFFKGPSKLDALHKVISNSEHALDSKNINVRFSGKYLVGSPQSVGTTTTRGLSETEKTDIVATMLDNRKQVYPVGTAAEVRRFVESTIFDPLDKSFMADFFMIGSMMNIPRDVLETYMQSSTYENQEKARAAHISYCLSPKGNEWMDKFEVFFGYPTQGKNIVISWDHLPLMQVFEKERGESKKVTVDTLTSLLNLGISIDEANEFLGTQFTLTPKENVQQLPTEEG